MFDLSSQQEQLVGVAVVIVMGLVIIAIGAVMSPRQPAPNLAEIRDVVEDGVCPRCGGTGEADLLDDFDIPMSYDEPCPRCSGTGYVGVA